MKRLHWIAVSATFAVAALLLFVWPAALAQQQQQQRPAGPFVGKVLVIYIDAEDRGAVLEDPQVQLIGERRFITGTSVDLGDRDWMRGAKVWMAVDDIIYLVEFNSVDDYRRRLAEHVDGGGGGAGAEALPATRPALRGGGL